MRQQINLFQPIFSQERKQLSALTLAKALGIIIAMLAGLSFYANRTVDQLEVEVASMRERAAKMDEMVAKSNELQAAHGNPADLHARVKELNETVAARKRALGVLQQGAAGQVTGFAPRFEALARRHVDGLWIDGLVLSGTNGSMTLRGAALNADTVPAYLQSLAQERALAGTRFDDFVIERPGKEPPQETSAAEETSVAKSRPIVSGTQIRFRAGSKALSTSQAAEAST